MTLETLSDQLDRRTAVSAIVVVMMVVLGLAGFATRTVRAPTIGPEDTSGDAGDDGAGTTDWRRMELRDVVDNRTFTVAGLEKPVLIETFAVWCSTCTRQQQEIQRYLAQGGNASVVSLNVDPNEDALAVLRHADRYGFDWRYAIAPVELSRQLAERYGQDMLIPPAVPKLLVCANGTRRLENGVKTADALADAIEQGCRDAG